MSLLAVVLILIVWGIYKIWDALTPPAPPIDDMQEHLNYILSLDTPEQRRRYLRSRRKGMK
ncbi:MAG: hypothetical protein LUG52_10205 [Clostridia bacterium]|nr:hypothetical protein [Clostridia bacterium]